MEMDDTGIGRKELPFIAPTDAPLRRYTFIRRGRIGVGARFSRNSLHFVDTNTHHQIICF
jgi:hypothetical protein